MNKAGKRATKRQSKAATDEFVEEQDEGLGGTELS